MASTTISKKKVAEAAAKAKVKHGWCDEIDQMLRDIGIEPVAPPMVEVTVSVPLDSLLEAGGDDNWEGFLRSNDNGDKLYHLGTALQDISWSDRNNLPATFTLKEN